MTYDFIKAINELNGLYYAIGIVNAEQSYNHLNESNGTIMSNLVKRANKIQEEFMKFCETHFLVFDDYSIPNWCRNLWDYMADAGEYSVFTLDKKLIPKTLEKAEKEYEYIMKHINENYTLRKKPIHICRRCHSIVTKKNVSKGYSYYCPECDEDKYKFETIYTNIVPKTN